MGEISNADPPKKRYEIPIEAYKLSPRQLNNLIAESEKGIDDTERIGHLCSDLRACGFVVLYSCDEESEPELHRPKISFFIIEDDDLAGYGEAALARLANGEHRVLISGRMRDLIFRNDPVGIGSLYHELGHVVAMSSMTPNLHTDARLLEKTFPAAMELPRALKLGYVPAMEIEANRYALGLGASVDTLIATYADLIANTQSIGMRMVQINMINRIIRETNAKGESWYLRDSRYSLVKFYVAESVEEFQAEMNGVKEDEALSAKEEKKEAA